MSHLDDMKKFIKLADHRVSSPVNIMESTKIKPVIKEDTIVEKLLNDLEYVRFKLNSYRELNENLEYSKGVEEGLELASEMINRLLEKYSGY